MGLDMYLTKHNYVQNWTHMKPEQLHEITIKRGAVVREDIKTERITYIIEEVGYWRKANGIHAWFVENCQDGQDNCQETYVSEEQLHELLRLCKLVSANHSLAGELLPTQPGFFFGSTEYDEYYFEEIEETIKILEDALIEPEGDGFYYRASW